VKRTLNEEGITGVSGIGPVDIDFNSGVAMCDLYLQNTDTVLPSIEPIYTGNETLIVRFPEIRRNVGGARLFAAPLTPYSLPGRLRGGDACQNTILRQFGTIALAGDIRVQRIDFRDVCLSCRHVLFDPDNQTIESPRFGPCMDLLWANPVPEGGKWIDIAVAQLRNNSIYLPETVRALGSITGIRQPSVGTRVMKYGAGTGLTSGRDRGLVWRAVDSRNPGTLYLVRTVSGWFSDVGDSGAAVLDRDRNLLGIIFGGIPSVIGERWYLPALPEGEDPVDRSLSTFEITF
jgi:hypothetical protein